MEYENLYFNFENISGVLNTIKLCIHLIITLIITIKIIITGFNIFDTRKDKAWAIIFTLGISLVIYQTITHWFPIWIYLPVLIIGILLIRVIRWFNSFGGGSNFSSSWQENCDCGCCSYAGQCSGNPCLFDDYISHQNKQI